MSNARIGRTQSEIDARRPAGVAWSLALAVFMGGAAAHAQSVDAARAELIANERDDEIADRLEAGLTVRASNHGGAIRWTGVSLITDGLIIGSLAPLLWGLDESQVPAGVVVVGAVGGLTSVVSGIAVLAAGSPFGALSNFATDARRRYPPREAMLRVEREWEREAEREWRRSLVIGGAELLGGLGIAASSFALFGAHFDLGGRTVASIIVNGVIGVTVAGIGVYHMVDERPVRAALGDWRRHHGVWRSAAPRLGSPALAVSSDGFTLGWSGRF